MRTAAAGALMLGIGATAAADNIAVETVTEKRLEDASYVLRPVFEELGGHGYTSSSSRVNALLSKRVSRPGDVWGPEDVKRFRADIEKGYQHWLSGEYTEAVGELERSLTALYERPVTVAENQTLRDSVHRGLVGIALAKHRLKDTEASHRAMARVVREFPDREFSRRKYGPEAVGIFAKVNAKLNDEAKATLTVTVDDPGAVVFVNERFTAIGGTTQELYPGTYRIYVQRGKERGRVHLVELAPGQKLNFEVDWHFERAVTEYGDTLGLFFPDSSVRDRKEAAYAARLGEGADADEVVLVSLRPKNGKPAVVGSVVNPTTGKLVRSGYISADPSPRLDQLKALARFLAAGDVSGGVVAEIGAPAIDEDRAPSRVPWVLGGVGLGAVAAGATLVLLDGFETCSERDTRACEHVLDTALGGYVSLGVGAAAVIGAGVWLLLRDDGDGDETAITVVPSPSGAVVGLSGRF